MAAFHLVGVVLVLSIVNIGTGSRNRTLEANCNQEWNRVDRILEVFMLGDKEIIAFVGVSSADKARALKAVLEGPYEPEQLPAQLIQPASGKLLWLVDQAAGAMLATGIRNY